MEAVKALATGQRVVTVILNRPKALNALTTDMCLAIKDVITKSSENQIILMNGVNGR